MDNDQMSLLRAALERAAATRRGGMQPPNFDMTGMFNPQAMASQGQPGMQPSPQGQIDARFGGMQPPAQPTFAERFGGMDPAVLAKGDMLQASPNQRVAQNFPPQMAGGIPTPQPRPQMAQAPMPTPQPQPQPAQAPSPMGFFQRNAAMMHDPVTGGFIDPAGAAQAQAGGSNNIINKMLGLLNQKANNA
jgi:hypothetical protein